MALLWLAERMILDNATFRRYLMEWHTPRFLQACITQYFSEMMAMLWVAEGIILDNAPFHNWMTEFHIPRFLSATVTQYFSEVMALLWLAERTVKDNATFRLYPGTWYAADVSVGRNLVLQLDCSCQADAMLLTFSGLTGDEVMRLNASPSDPAWNTHKHIAHELKVPLQSLQVVLPDGQLLAAACRANPGASLADVIETRKRRRLT